MGISDYKVELQLLIFIVENSPHHAHSRRELFKAPVRHCRAAKIIDLLIRDAAPHFLNTLNRGFEGNQYKNTRETQEKVNYGSFK